MNSQDLINLYQTQLSEEKQAQQRKQDEILAEAQKVFEANCRVWLGDLWDELQPGEIHAEFQNRNRSGAISIRRSIRYMGFDGQVVQTAELKSDGRLVLWATSEVEFGALDFGKLFYLANFTLYQKDGVPQPVAPTLWGELFLKLAEYAPIVEERQRKELESRRQDALKFDDWRSLKSIKDKLEDGLQKFPDLADQLTANAQAAINVAAAKEAELQAEEEHRNRVNAEHARLQIYADHAWNCCPFYLFSIEYGAHVEGSDDEREVLTRDFISDQDRPGPDGYWSVLDGGRIRNIKPKNVMSIERIMVTSQQDCPYDAKRFVTIGSKDVPEAAAYVALPPESICDFDIDAIKEELFGDKTIPGLDAEDR